MNLFRKSNASGSSEKANPIYVAIAAFIMVFYESAKWCNDKVYSGWSGLFAVLFGLPTSIAGGIASAHYASSTLGIGGFWSTVLGIVGWLVVLFYLFPLFWRFIAKPAFDLVDAIYDRVREYSKKWAQPFFGGIVKIASTICVGSGGAWDRVLSKEHEDTWFAKLLGIVGYVSSFGGCAYLGWQVFTYLAAAISLPLYGGYIIAAFAAIVVGGALMGLIYQFLEYGKLAFIGLAVSAGAVWGAAPYLSSLTGLTGVAGYGVLAAAFVVTLGYLFPLLNLMLTNGFWARVWKFVKPLPEKTYDEEDNKYGEFFHHVVNFILTAGTTGGAWYIAATAGLPLWGIAPIALVVAALTYIIGFKVLNWGGGNFLTGGALSLASAFYVGKVYTDAGFIYGVYGGIIAGVFALLVTGVVIFPIVYLGIRFVLHAIGAANAADPLTKLYNAANEQFKKAMKEVRHAYDNCYRDKSSYKEFALHLVNLGVTYAAFTGTLIAVAALAPAAWLGWTAVAVGTLLTYILVGKLLLKVGYGLEFAGGVGAVFAGLWVGNLVFTATGAGTIASMIAAVVSGIAAWCATYFVAIPVAYVVAKFLTNFLLASWLRPVLAGIHGFFWAGFKGIWTGFVASYNWLWEVTAPFRAGIARGWARVAEQYRRILKIIRGGR